MSKQRDCSRFVSLQDRRLADEAPLSDADLEFLAEHGRRCAACGLEGAGLQALRRVGGQDAAELSDEEVARGVEHVLGRARERAPKQRPWFRPLLRPLPVGLAAAAAAVVLVVLLRMGPTEPENSQITRVQPSTPPARLTLVVGQVQVDGRPVTARSRLTSGQRVRVGRGGRAVLSFGDGTAALLSDDTEVRVLSAPGGVTRFALNKGAATFRVAPRDEHRPVEVVASWGRVQVVGTVFRVTDQVDSRLVQVSRGRVRVLLPSEAPVILEAGQQLDASGFRGTLDAPSWRRLRAAVKLVGQLPARGGGVLEVHASAPQVQVAVDSILVGRAPVALVLQPGLRRIAAIRDGRAWATREVALSSGQRAEVRFELPGNVSSGVAKAQPEDRPTPARSVSSPGGKRVPGASRRMGVVPAPVPPAVSTAPGVQPAAPTVVSPTPPSPAVETVAQLLSRAAKLRAQRSWSRVVGVYRRIIALHPGAPEAATSLVLMGQVQLRQLRQATGALRSFQRYLRLRSRGALAPEAAWGRVESLRQLGRKAAERKACLELLRRYPASIYAARVRSRLKALGSVKTGPN